MAAYTVNHRYTAFRDGQKLGPWDAGDTIDLTEADAEWVNRDSPGTLVGAGAKTEPERQAPAAPNRQHKGGRNRAGA